MPIIVPAAQSDAETVLHITRETICTVYPHYYPAGAVAFFLAHHAPERIAADIAAGGVYLLIQDGIPAGTVTLSGCEICRLFVLPEFQHRGFGRMLLDFSEGEILARHDSILLDASLPAKAIYLSRGYAIIDSHVIPAGNGDYLCYDVMKKGR